MHNRTARSLLGAQISSSSLSLSLARIFPRTFYRNSIPEKIRYGRIFFIIIIIFCEQKIHLSLAPRRVYVILRGKSYGNRAAVIFYQKQNIAISSTVHFPQKKKIMRSILFSPIHYRQKDWCTGTPFSNNDSSCDTYI